MDIKQRIEDLKAKLQKALQESDEATTAEYEALLAKEREAEQEFKALQIELKQAQIEKLMLEIRALSNDD